MLSHFWNDYNISGIAFCLAIVLFYPACVLFGRWLNTPDKPKAPRIRPIGDPVAPAPSHVHIVDMDRSKVHVTDTGAIIGRCAIAGCEEPIYIAPNLAGTYVGDPERVDA
jgi:hypothetical protein